MTMPRCRRHRTYRGKRKPVGNCEQCRGIWFGSSIAGLESWLVDDPLSPFIGEDVVCVAEVVSVLRGSDAQAAV